MILSGQFYLRLVFICGSTLLVSSCFLPMLGTGQALAGGHIAECLRSSSSLELVWRGNICSFPSFGLEKPRCFKVSPADAYSLLMDECPGISGEWACYCDRNCYYWAFVSGKNEEDAGTYTVRHGIAVNGTSGEIEKTISDQTVSTSVMM